MNGKVVYINPDNGLLVVKTERGSFSVVEAIGGYDFETGDVLSGNLETDGSKTIRNESQSENINACVQGVFSSREEAVGLTLHI